MQLTTPKPISNEHGLSQIYLVLKSHRLGPLKTIAVVWRTALEEEIAIKNTGEIDVVR